MTNKEILSKLNLQLPVVASPMFIVSQLELVKAACTSGIIGTFPALNQRTTEGFDQWCVELNEYFAEYEAQNNVKLPPYGVNLIVHKTNPRAFIDLDICVKNKVPIIITSLGAAREVVDKVHAYGGMVFHDVTNKYHAQKAIQAGVDGLICVSAGAGGHAGTLNPIPFVQEIREIFDGLILLGGCLSNGQDVASALQMGADIAYMGTRFINVKEAIAKPEYQDMIIQSGSKDIIYTASVSGIPANYLAESLVSAGITRELWENKAKVDFGKELDVEVKAWKDLWSAGQGVATIKDNLTVKELVTKLKAEFKEAINRQNEYLNVYHSS